MTLAEVDDAALGRICGLNVGGREHATLGPCWGAADRRVMAWLQTMDIGFRAVVGGSVPPIWIYETFKWGPHPWPVRWRDIPMLPYVDCGLMAALSTEVFRWRGVSAVPVQVVLHFNRWSSCGWANLWRNAGLAADWCAGDYAYHEVTGVVDRSGGMKLWDALGRFWIPVGSAASYEGVVALRVCEPVGVSRLATINGQRLRSGRWHAIAELRREILGDRSIRRDPSLCPQNLAV